MKHNIVEDIKEALKELARPEKAEFLPRFFKTGKGEYAEGDKFLGVVVPDQRKVAGAYYMDISAEELHDLLIGEFHEYRLTALLMLISKFEKAETIEDRGFWVEFYLAHLPYINNWDLVDTSAYKILGNYCYELSDISILDKLANDDNMWHKRIAIVATMYHIKKGELSPTLKFAKLNMNHPHDLMHKANGWLLRELGKKNESILIKFLQDHYQILPRTTLRYAIEKFDREERQNMLKGVFS